MIIELILICGLPVVMLAQGLALKPDDLRLTDGEAMPVIGMLLLRLIVMPLVAYGAGQVLGLEPALAVGLILVTLAVPTVAALPLAGVSGATLPLLSSMIAVGTLAGLIWWPIAVNMLVENASPIALWRDMLLLAGLPFAAGLYLRARGTTGGRLLPIVASVAIGAMNLCAIIRGFDLGVWTALKGAIVLAIVAILTGILLGRVMQLRSDGPTTLAYAVMMSAVALPIGLSARMDPAFGLPSGVYGFVIYCAATVLITMRMRAKA